MASLPTLLLVFVLQALLATALGGVCDYMSCYQKFTLMGTDDLFCEAARVVVNCAETTLDNNPDCASVQRDIDEVVTRVKDIIHCYGCAGNSISISALTLCCGLVLATYFSRSK